jgi:hypothetical protein
MNADKKENSKLLPSYPFLSAFICVYLRQIFFLLTFPAPRCHPGDSHWQRYVNSIATKLAHQ